MKKNEIIFNKWQTKNFVASDTLQNSPRYLLIENCGSCNARCIMCPAEDVLRSKRLMKPDVFNATIESIKPHANNLERVSIQGHGEPLLDKKLEEKITKLRSIGINNIGFNTNASLMSPQRSKSLIEAGLNFVYFSIDGAKKNTFEKIRKRLVFEECVDNIIAFIQSRERLNKKVHIRLTMTVMESNKDEWDEFYNFWKKYLGPEDEIKARKLHSFGGWYQEEFFNNYNQKPCISPFTTMCILCDGRVALCCVDYNGEVTLGNILENTITEIWQSKKLESIRNVHLTDGRGAMKFCKDCTVWD